VIVLWIVAAIYVLTSDWRESATVVLPIFMAAAAFVVILLNAIAGSIAQHRNDLEALDQSTFECLTCHRSNEPLHVIDYHSYLFLGAHRCSIRPTRKIRRDVRNSANERHVPPHPLGFHFLSADNCVGVV
jgi:hypothetical protein